MSITGLSGLWIFAPLSLLLTQPPIDAPPLVVRQKRRWLVGAVAREMEPAFKAHVQHLR